jgi:CRP/FNR family transcriptional regulator, cyclic AMP receptor protein
MDDAHLSTLPLFGALSKRERREVAQHADEIDIAEGTELVKEGSFAYQFFVIEDGIAEVIRDGRHVADLGPGDFLGEMGLLAHDRRNATVVARSPMTVIVMSSQDLRSVEAQMPDVAHRIQSAAGERSRALTG